MTSPASWRVRRPGGRLVSSARPAGARRELGQATVELAVGLVLLSIALLLFVQVALVFREQLLVTQAAREVARVAAVDPVPAAALAATRSTPLDPARLRAVVGARPGPDGLVRVKVEYESVLRMPVTGDVLMRPILHASAAMRVEGR